MKEQIAIIAAVRTPLGAFLGQLAAVPAPASAALCLQALLARTTVSIDYIGALYIGCVFTSGLGAMPARQAAQHAGLSPQMLCRVVHQAGCSGLASVQLAFEGLTGGAYQAALAGGMECMSGAPYCIPHMRHGHPLGNHQLMDTLMHDALIDPITRKPIGALVEGALEQTTMTRVALDNYVVHSLSKACHAQESGAFSEELVPVRIKVGEALRTIGEDEWPKRLRQKEIAACRPSFKTDGCITSASSAALADGASMLLLARGNEQTFSKVPVLGYILGFAHVGAEPEAYLHIASRAIQKLLAAHQLSVADIDVFEIQETFACIPLITIQTLEIPGERVNPLGGGCSLGDALGASGSRMLTTLMHYLHHKQLRRGIVVVAQAGCEALAVLVARY